MAVQPAAAQAREFYQAVSPQAGTQSSAGRAFEDMLSSMRGVRQPPAVFSERKSVPVGTAAVRSCENAGDIAQSDAQPQAEELFAEAGESGEGLFDPDLILRDGFDAAENVKSGQDAMIELAASEDDAAISKDEIYGERDGKTPDEEASEPDSGAAPPDSDTPASVWNQQNIASIAGVSPAKTTKILPDAEKSSGQENTASKIVSCSVSSGRPAKHAAVAAGEGPAGDPEAFEEAASGTVRDDEPARGDEPGDESFTHYGGQNSAPDPEIPDREPGLNTVRESRGDGSSGKNKTAAKTSEAADGAAEKDNSAGAFPAIKPGGEETVYSTSPRPDVRQVRETETPAVRLPETYALRKDSAFGEGLSFVVDFMRKDSSAQARIVVEPPALGRVDISLSSTSAGVEANFRVDSEELGQMVQGQLDSLKASLHAQGIHVSELTVDIRNSDSRQGRNEPYGSKAKSRRGAMSEGDEDAPDAKIVRLDLENGLLHWVA
ncbi:MAG: flagellar hook-length control protein FliK [Synergistaceae bacterium]|jgi:hypothetical protein|nr:flagellar hook-length control protein FliK [Synergistaceae bacterium]